MKELEIEEIEKIFEETESNWEGDNAFKGMQIISRYTDEIVRAAEHDIIYCGDIGELVSNGITKEDIIELAKLNWMVDEFGEGFSCFV